MHTHRGDVLTFSVFDGLVLYIGGNVNMPRRGVKTGRSRNLTNTTVARGTPRPRPIMKYDPKTGTWKRSGKRTPNTSAGNRRRRG